jgi:hypothetical protein
LSRRCPSCMPRAQAGREATPYHPAWEVQSILRRLGLRTARFPVARRPRSSIPARRWPGIPASPPDHAPSVPGDGISNPWSLRNPRPTRGKASSEPPSHPGSGAAPRGSCWDSPPRWLGRFPRAAWPRPPSGSSETERPPSFGGTCGPGGEAAVVAGTPAAPPGTLPTRGVRVDSRAKICGPVCGTYNRKRLGDRLPTAPYSVRRNHRFTRPLRRRCGRT